MAFQTSALPGLAAATTQLWPSVSSAMAPWRSFLGKTSPPPSSSRISQSSPVAAIAPATTTAKPIARTEIPECLRDLQPSFATQLTPRIVSNMPTNIQHTLSAMSTSTLRASNPIIRRASFAPIAPQSRMFSTAIRSQFIKPEFAPRGIISQVQRRSLFGSSTSQNTLAHLEETANRNPNSATSQYAFYQALIRANMPAIIIERYETGRFASNQACENVYHRAIGANAVSGNSDASFNQQPQTNFGGQQQGNLNSVQLQAVGQAVAASTRGGNVAISKGPQGSGAKDAPLHVVVEETIGGAIFKWVKFFFYFCLVTYVSMVLVATLVEALTIFKKPGAGKHASEAKAEHQTVRFSDVHGCEEAKEELQELVDFLKNPDKFNNLGGKLPKGVLLVGPPGTGKTLLARAVAGEAGVPFFFMSGSEFDEVYVGVGAKRVRDLFASAKGKSPAIVFIDELDAIGGKRNARDASYVKQTLNQLLTELDGFEQNSGVIILAATNFPEMLDKALTRPGRFDRNVVVGLPDVRGRIAILQYHMKKITAAADVNVQTIAQRTPGLSGAELENIINQAAVHASKAKATAVTMLDFEWAKDKIMMGAERKSMVITQEAKLLTAYHEAGHALAIMLTPGTDKLHKITILPRGQALGITSHLPEMDKYSNSVYELEADIDVCMGGKVAEELIYGPTRVTGGCSSDLQQATAVAYNMVTRMGMSEKLGHVDLASNYENLSAGTKELIESEVRRLLAESYVRVTALLTTHRKELELLTKALVEYETLDGAEAHKVIKGEKLEGRLISPPGSIKVPVSGGNHLPEIPKIPGTPGASEQPPVGGPPAAAATEQSR